MLPKKYRLVTSQGSTFICEAFTAEDALTQMKVNCPTQVIKSIIPYVEDTPTLRELERAGGCLVESA